MLGLHFVLFVVGISFLEVGDHDDMPFLQSSDHLVVCCSLQLVLAPVREEAAQSTCKLGEEHSRRARPPENCLEFIGLGLAARSLGLKHARATGGGQIIPRTMRRAFHYGQS